MYLLKEDKTLLWLEAWKKQNEALLTEITILVGKVSLKALSFGIYLLWLAVHVTVVAIGSLLQKPTLKRAVGPGLMPEEVEPREKVIYNFNGFGL